MNARITALCVLLCVFASGCESPPRLDNYGVVPAFAFEDSEGQPIGKEELSGSPWVANFLFTSCPSQCPPLARSTAALQKEIATWPKDEQGVRLVSISVDPITDTPERLRAFAKEYGAEKSIWTFARGDVEEMTALVTQGFMMPLLRKDVVKGMSAEAKEQAMREPTPLDTAHSLRFVLIDRDFQIRGLFENTEEDLAALLRSLRWLARQP